MILATHALVGAAIGDNIDNPWLIIATSLVVHYFLDSFRHGEYFDDRKATIKTDGWKVAIDLSIPFFVLLFFIYQNQEINKIFNVLLGSFFSILPDFFTLLYWKFHWQPLAQIKKFHAWCHHYTKFPKYSPERAWTLRNAANDIIFSLIAITILFLK